VKRSSAALIGFFLLVFILPLGVRPIIIPDETRYAEIPREMIVSGDWIVPHLNGLRYFEKPVAGYWLSASAMMVFGENAFASRLPSALSAGISALMLFFLARRFAGGHWVGVLAAFVFLTSFLVFGVGTFNVLDSALSMFLTGAMVTFFFAHMEDRPARRFGLLATSGIFCGLAFLTKGFLAFVVPVVALVPFMIWEGRWKALFRVCWVPLMAALLVSLPWAVAIHLREPDFWNFFFWHEHVQRFMAENAQHTESFWYFFLLLPCAALPWTFLFPAAASGMRGADFKNPVIRYALCWFLFPILFFSFSNGKLLTYILPCFPPIALLTAMGLSKDLKRPRTGAFKIGSRVLALVVGMLAVALLVVQATGFHGLKPYVHNWKWALAAAGLSAWAGLLLISAREPGRKKRIILYGAGPALLMFITPFSIPDHTIEHKAPGQFLLAHAREIRPDTILVSSDDPVRAVCWFYKRDDVYLLEQAGELSYGLEYADSRHRRLEPDQFWELVRKNRGTGRVVLVLKARLYREWKGDLPEPISEDSNGEGGFVFVKY
jgi:4-amino-4-deoxy-L-arabinose transferase